MNYKEKLQKTVLRRKKQEKSRVQLRCADLHAIELGIPPPPLQLLELRLRPDYKPQSRPTSDPDSDTPAASLYRLYRHVVLRQVDLIEDEVEYFWSRRWDVASIPDPFDRVPERAAVLACCTFLLAEDFNGRITLDLTDEEQSARDRLEKPPRWALESAPLPYKLFLGAAAGANAVEIAPPSRLFMIKNVHIDLTDLGLG